MLFAYELSGLNKLCTLLVENERVVEAVVNVNRKIKGRKINVLPMSFIERQPQMKKLKIPDISDCYSLLREEWIKIKPHSFGGKFTKSLEKIIVSTFNSHVLVKDYSLGLEVSKKYFVNCITADKEIVYSEGYHCKVGKDINVDDRLESFLNYSEKNHDLQEASKNLEEVSKKANSLKNGEMELMKQKI